MRSQRITVSLCLFVLLVTIAFCSRQSHRNTASVPAAELQTRTQASAAVLEGDTDSRAAARAANAPEHGVRFVSEDELQDPPPALRVLDADGMTPVAGAEVFVLAIESTDWFEEFVEHQAPDWTREKHLRRCGRRFLADPDGFVLLPRGYASVAVCARAGERFAHDVLDLDGFGVDELTLEPTSARSLTIEVLDHLGAPQRDVTVSIEFEPCGRSWEGTSDVHGFALVPLETIPGSGSGWLSITVAGGAARELERTLAAEELDRQPLVFHLPGLGAVHAHLRAPAATAGLLRGWASASALRVDRAASPVSLSGAGASIDFQGSDVLLPGIEAGTILNVELNVPGLDRLELSTEIEGPRVPGETVDVAFELPPEFAIVEACCVDEQGAPFAERELRAAQLVLGPDGRPSESSTFLYPQTDVHGRIAWPVKQSVPRAASAPAPASLRWLLWTTKGGELLWAESARPQEIASAHVDLGTLVFHPLATLLRGRVIDQAGLPLEGVRVTPWFDESISLDDLPGMARTWTDAQGRFAIRGMPLKARLECRFYLEHSTLAFDEPRPGFELPCEEEPEFTLRREVCAQGSVAGSALVDRGASFSSYRLRMLDAAEECERTPSSRSGPDGFQFRFHDLAPGTWHLVVRYESSSATLFVIEGIEVRAEQVTLDPRLQQLDLRRFAARPEPPRQLLFVRDANGARLDHGRILWCAKGASDPTKEDWSHGRIELDPAIQGQVCIWSPGCSAFLGELPRGTETLTLAPARKLRLRVELPQAIRDARPRMTLVINGLRAEGLLDGLDFCVAFDESIQILDERGACEFALPCPCRPLFRVEGWVGPLRDGSLLHLGFWANWKNLPDEALPDLAEEWVIVPDPEEVPELEAQIAQAR